MKALERVDSISLVRAWYGRAPAASLGRQPDSPSPDRADARGWWASPRPYHALTSEVDRSRPESTGGARRGRAGDRIPTGPLRTMRKDATLGGKSRPSRRGAPAMRLRDVLPLWVFVLLASSCQAGPASDGGAEGQEKSDPYYVGLKSP